MTLRTRLALGLVFAVGVAALVFALAARATVERLLYDDVDRDLRGEVQRTIETMRRRDMGRGFGNPDSDRPSPTPGRFFGSGALIAEIRDEDGSVLLRTSGVDAIGGLPEADLDADDRVEMHTVRIEGERFRIAASRTEVRGDEAVVQVARPLDDISDFLDTLMWVLVAAGAAAVLAAIGFGRWAARATLRPVEQMTRTAREIRETRDLSRRVEPAFPDVELADFAAATNDMLESLQHADRSQRAFVADASHELRSPLTSLSGNATFLGRARELDEDARDAITAVGRDVERIVRIADGLTTLARLDAAPATQLEPVDVDELTDTVLDRARERYPDHTFTREGELGTQLLDHELLERIIGNLVDNAGRYTPAGTDVVVQLAHTDETLTLVVTDDGPGIPAEERDIVLERFHRGSTAAGATGTGLGLPIVAEAARMLGGALQLAPAEPTGLRCTVSLPAAGSVPPTRG